MTTPTMPFSMSLAGPDAWAIVEVLRRQPELAGPPGSLTIDDEEVEVGDGWEKAVREGTGSEMFASWDPGLRIYVARQRNGIVKVRLGDRPFDPADALALVAALPVEVVAFGSMFAEWHREPAAYAAPGFGEGHFPHGWACAFRGAGHRRLVSRRWLEHGPWTLLRGEPDTSLVQFHAVDVDPPGAIEQARRGHILLGNGDDSGFLSTDHDYPPGVPGLYDAALRRQRVVILDREVSPGEMLAACALRATGGDDPDRPVERVAFFFFDEQAARRHLHALWLRELECWTIVEGAREERLDEGYRPPR